ncbi:MAG: TPM domain-containing protein [Bacteroidota bacterium]|nr:TPM domain-containing protein [Bacteroidota bacterium]
MKPSKFFKENEKKLISESIQEAEKNTSGEIRVHIESKCAGNVMDRAAYLFQKLKMHETKLRNGVLFYLALDDKKFAILGDAGINQVTADNFWDNIKDAMLKEFTNNDFTSGLSMGITMAGEQLIAHFPYQQDDINELPDEISFGDKSSD